MATVTPDSAALAAVVYHPDLSPTFRLIAVSQLLDPGLSQSERARVLGVARNTVRAALAVAERLALGAQPRTTPAQPRTTPLRNHAPGAQPRTTPPSAGAALPDGQGQAQGRPPLPPRATTPKPRAPRSVVQQLPLPEPPKEPDVAREAVAEVRRLRLAEGLATGANDRVIAQVLAELRAEGHQLDTVVAALGRSLVVSVPSVVLTMNDGKVARAQPQRKPAPYAATNDNTEFLAAAAEGAYRSWKPD
jgi:transposase-like protein